MKSIRIGFIGAGGIAQHHIKELRAIPEAQIVAICDVDAVRAQSVARSMDASVHTDAARLIATETLDALYVCVPPYAHGDIEIRAARRALHLFIEKPVCLDLDQARKTADAIRTAGIMTQAGYVLRYTTGGLQLKEFLNDKPIGTAQVTRWGGLPTAPWWRRYDQSGGQLHEMTTHQVDLLRWVMGEVEAVCACSSSRRLFKDQPDVTVPDSQTVLLRFASGACATINTSCAAGKTGQGSVDFVLRNAIVRWKPDAIEIDPPDSYPLPPIPQGNLSIDAAFVRAVATTDRSLLRSPYEDALRSATVTLAANRSIEENGRWIPLEEM